MAKDLTVVLEDRPGTLAALGEALGKGGVNVEGICAVPAGGKATVHVLVEDSSAARQALQKAGVQVAGEQDVLVMSMEDKPGSLGAVARKLANAGVNITALYLATRTRVVIVASDMAKAKKAVGM